MIILVGIQRVLDGDRGKVLVENGVMGVEFIIYVKQNVIIFFFYYGL